MSVDYLCRELARLHNSRHQLQVLCFGDQRETGLNFAVTEIAGMPELFRPEGGNGKIVDVLGVISPSPVWPMVPISCTATPWYSYLAGCLIKQFLEIPMVITVHSLEPKRPWKREQAGTDTPAGVQHDALLSIRRGFKISELSSLLRQLDSATVLVEPARWFRVAAIIWFNPGENS